VNMAVHYLQKTHEWATPQALYDELNAEFKFDLDPCCTEGNAKCDMYFTEKDDGLTQPWAPQRVFMNPPYGYRIKFWMKKAYEESLRGALVVCLVPSRTDTAWWHDYAMKGDVRFIRGRLYFGDGEGRSPFPNAIVIFRPSQSDTATEPHSFDCPSLESGPCDCSAADAGAEHG
jgi:phage N-6-adenine-methyltransferase